MEGKILTGPPLLYEPSEGGIGFEIFHALSRNKEKIAQYIIETEEIDTYGSLLERSIKTAMFSLEKNLKKDDIVCLYSENNLNSAVPFIASQFIGVIYTGIEPAISEIGLIHFLNYIQPKILFVSEKLQNKLERCMEKSNISCEIISTKFSKDYDTENFQPVYLRNLKDTAAIFLTSGSTGTSKGICSSHYSILAQIFNTLFHYGCPKGTIRFSDFSHSYDEQDNLKYMSYSPMHWISGVFAHGMFFSGGSIILGDIFSGKNAWNAMKKYKPNFIYLYPGQANEICSYAKNKTKKISTEVFLTGGDPISDTFLKYIEECFPNTLAVQMYGMTECTDIITSFKIDDLQELKLLKEKPQSCGKVTAGIQLKVVDIQDGKICGAGQLGELRLKSKFLMNGYYKNDSSVQFDSDGWFKTGDVGYFDEDGCVFVFDRLNEILLYSLYIITPSVIEHILIQHPAVSECTVIGFPHPVDNEHPMGIVVLKNGYKGKTTEEEILTFVNDKVTSENYKIRAGIVFVDEIPKTATAKIKKYEMKQLIVEARLKEYIGS